MPLKPQGISIVTMHSAVGASGNIRCDDTQVPLKASENIRCDGRCTVAVKASENIRYDNAQGLLKSQRISVVTMHSAVKASDG